MFIMNARLPCYTDVNKNKDILFLGMNTNKKTPSIIGILIAIVLLLTIVITRCNSMNQQQPDSVPTTPSPTAQAYAGYEYRDEENGLLLSIPTNWTKVIMHGYVTFVDPVTAASIQIQIHDRTPDTLNFNDQRAVEYVRDLGGSFSQFRRTTVSSFIIEYSVNGTIYIEYWVYDRVTCVHFICSVPEEHYRDYIATFDQLLSTAIWEQKNMIPYGITLLYNEAGSYEYGSPSEWSRSQTDKTFYAQSKSGDATMSIVFDAGEQNFSNITKESFLAENADKFHDLEFRRFSVDKSILYVEGVYSRGDSKTILVRYSLSSNGNTYTITFIAPYNEYNQDAQIYTDCIRMFKVIK